MNTPLTREELIERLDHLEFHVELRDELDSLLHRYLQKKDIEVVRKLLAAGASPNSKDDLHDYLLWLLHEYEAVRSTDGDRVLALMRTLLESGADPNRVTMNNLRAYDYAVSGRTDTVRELLEQFGAHKQLREFV